MQKRKTVHRLNGHRGVTKIDGKDALQVLDPVLGGLLTKALEAIQADDLVLALTYFGKCCEIDPVNKAVLYFGSETAQKAYFARKFADPPAPHEKVEQWRNAAFTLTVACAEARPDDAVAIHNVGRFLDDELAPTYAIPWYEKALQIDRSQVESWANLGTCHATLGDMQKAEHCWSKAVAFDAVNPSGLMSQGYIWLRRGDYLRGWKALNARWADPAFQGNYGRKDLGGRPWTGQPLKKSDTLFLHGEQGLGDHVQFARYIPKLLARGIKVVGLETRPALRRWFDECLKDTPVVVYVRYDKLPGFTHHAPLMSLPGLLGMEELPEPLSPVSWRGIVPRGTKQARVGLTWKGASGNGVDAIRSIPDDLLRHLADIPSVTFVPLQYDPSGSADITARSWLGKNVEQAPDYSDVYGMAEVMAGLDMVVTVDTLAAHVAGSVGVPTIVLHRHNLEWRWGQSPNYADWYPSASHLVQPTPGGWTTLLTALADRLAG